MKPIARDALCGTFAALCLVFGAPAEAQAQDSRTISRGMSWESLRELPALIGSQWIPEDAPSNERALLRQLPMPPLKAQHLADARDTLKSMLAGTLPVPSTTCAFDGMPRVAWYPYPLQFLFTAGYVNLLAHDVIRSAPLNGLVHSADLKDKNRLQGFDMYGAAGAAWVGNTLVIDTIATREDIGTFYGLANDPDLHVIERYRLLADDRLERLTSIESPQYFTAPWHLRTTFRRGTEAGWATRFCLPRVAASAKTIVAFNNASGKRSAAVLSPAPATARFTPNLNWDQLVALPKLWGRSWSSTRAYDEEIVYVNRMTLIPPLQPRYLAMSADFLERSRAGQAEFKAGACYPNGVPRSAWYSYAPGFVFRPGNSLLITSFGETREVFMDGRAHPQGLRGSDPSTAWLGHSVGWWEGEALVIDTMGFAPEHEIYYNVPNGGGMHVIERYRLLADNRLELILTVNNPERLTKPWVITRQYQAPELPDSTQSSQAARLDTQRCRPGLGREQIGAGGDSFVDLTPPPEGLGIGKQQ